MKGDSLYVIIRNIYKQPTTNMSLGDKLLKLSFEIWMETRMPTLTICFTLY